MNIKATCWALFLAAFPVHAALLSPADRDNIEQQQRDRLQQQQMQRDELERSQTLSLPAPAPAHSDEKPCFTISTINITQANHLSSSAQDRLTKPLIGKCLGIKRITQLVQEISDAYIERGYITRRVFFPSRISHGES